MKNLFVSFVGGFACTRSLNASKAAQQLDWRSIAREIGGLGYEFSAAQSTWQESGLAKLQLPARSHRVPKHSAKQTSWPLMRFIYNPGWDSHLFSFPHHWARGL